MSELTYIPEAIRPLAVPLDALKLDPKNARIHDDRNVEAIRKSLAEYGQDQLIVVQKEGMLVRIGSGRVIAARQLGWTHMAALILDENEVRSMARGIKDNRIPELASWDDAVLADILRTLTNGGIDAGMMGFSDAEIDAILGLDEVELRPLATDAPPKMAWVLIGIPTVRFGEISELIEQAARVEGVFCETVVNDDVGEQEKV